MKRFVLPKEYKGTCKGCGKYYVKVHATPSDYCSRSCFNISVANKYSKDNTPIVRRRKSYAEMWLEELQ